MHSVIFFPIFFIVLWFAWESDLTMDFDIWCEMWTCSSANKRVVGAGREVKETKKGLDQVPQLQAFMEPSEC